MNIARRNIHIRWVMDKPGIDNFKLFLKFAKYLLPYRKKEAAILALGGLTVLLGLVNPYLSKLVIDRAFGNKDLRVFIILALIGGTIFVLNGLVSGLNNYLERQIKIKVNFDLNRKAFKHLEKLDLSYFQDKSSGEHLYRASYDMDRAADFITTVLPEAIVTFPKLLFILIIVLRLNWQMAVFSLCLAPLLYLPPYYFHKRMRKVWEELIRNSEGIFKRLSEFFSHIQLVKAFGREAFEIRDYLRRRIANIRMSMKNTRLEAISGFAGSAVNKVVIGLIAFYGGYQVIRGEMTLGSLSAIMMYIGQLVGLQGNFAGFFQNITVGLVSCRRVEELLNEKSKITEDKNAKNIEFKKGQVVFKNVSFGYGQKAAPVLSGISFNIETGNCIALVGPSGCGKTTILNLILRLYDPWSGEVIIDGYDIKNLSFSSLKGQIAAVLQEPFLWNDSIENNIRYAKPDAGQQEVIEIAKVCGVDDFVQGLPQGYQAVIGENACKISEGQKQKIAIARALIKKPKILILDEAMSSMDSQSEGAVLLNIKKMPEILTVIIVSHRLSTVMKADFAYFLKRPDTIRINKPQQLFEEDEEFYNLFVAQLINPEQPARLSGDQAKT